MFPAGQGSRRASARHGASAGIVVWIGRGSHRAPPRRLSHRRGRCACWGGPVDAPTGRYSPSPGHATRRLRVLGWPGRCPDGAVFTQPRPPAWVPVPSAKPTDSLSNIGPTGQRFIRMGRRIGGTSIHPPRDEAVARVGVARSMPRRGGIHPAQAAGLGTGAIRQTNRFVIEHRPNGPTVRRRLWNRCAKILATSLTRPFYGGEEPFFHAPISFTHLATHCVPHQRTPTVSPR